jgi:hypothetical protein
MTEQRRLAAILVADVVGYYNLIGSDEAGSTVTLPGDDFSAQLRTARKSRRADDAAADGPANGI